jgi:hypothetical protein
MAEVFREGNVEKAAVSYQFSVVSESLFPQSVCKT